MIVGLANPGAEYAQTRHNAGAWYVDLLAQRHNQQLKEESKFFGYTARLNLAGNDVRLLVPTTFMNLSGKAVLAMANFYRIEPNEILVAHDELDLPPGVAKIKLGGGNGGHNGLKDIQNKFGNNPNFYRLRIGIGHPGDKNKVVGFVLGKPPASEQKMIDEAIDESLRCTEMLMKDGLEKPFSACTASRRRPEPCRSGRPARCLHLAARVEGLLAHAAVIGGEALFRHVILRIVQFMAAERPGALEQAHAVTAQVAQTNAFPAAR